MILALRTGAGADGTGTGAVASGAAISAGNGAPAVTAGGMGATTGGAAGSTAGGAADSTPDAKDRDMVATEATSAPHTEQEKRPGASGESHSGQTTVFVAIEHLEWNPDPPGPGLQAATSVRDRPIPRTVVRRCPERPGFGPDPEMLEGQN